jgi:tRNA threonylcarbamoyladenosine biosynthesis protein TsaE
VIRTEIAVATAQQMQVLGQRLATVLQAGDLVLLSGGLGAGKTTLTKGIGAGLGVRGPVTSPTFVIARVHPPLAGRGSAGPELVHVDAYRLGSALELDDLDLDTDAASAVTVVEWGGGLAEGLSADRLEITISSAVAGLAGAAEEPGENAPDDDDRPRTVLISGIGPRWEGIDLPLVGLADRL